MVLLAVAHLRTYVGNAFFFFLTTLDMYVAEQDSPGHSTKRIKCEWAACLARGERYSLTESLGPEFFCKNNNSTRTLYYYSVSYIDAHPESCSTKFTEASCYLLCTHSSGGGGGGDDFLVKSGLQVHTC